MKFKILFTVLLIFLFSNKTYSQCGCTPGASVGGLTPFAGNIKSGVMIKDHISISAFHKYSYGDRFLNGDISVDNEKFKEYKSHYSGIVASYGYSKKLTLEAELGHFPQKEQILEDSFYSTYGFSHIGFAAKYNVYYSKWYNLEYTAAFGIRVPLMEGNPLYPQHIIPSTGAFTFYYQSFLHKGIRSINSHLYLINRLEFNTRNNHTYQYGPAILTSLFYTYDISKAFTGLLEFRNEARMKDRYADEFMHDTGAIIFALAPQISYSYDNFVFSAFYEHPLYTYNYGSQLANNYSFGMAVRWATKFGK